MNTNIRNDPNTEHDDLEPKVLTKKSWSSYLHDNYINTSTFQERLGFADYMKNQELSGRVLYHLTLTYKRNGQWDYGVRDVNKFFTNFYLKKLLRDIVGTSYFNRDRYRHLQPICYAFIDEHEMKPVFNKKIEYVDGRLSDASVTHFPVRLHHHAILAAHPDTVDRLDCLTGENTLWKYSKIIMTSYLTRCHAGTILYSSKKLDQYRDDYLCFPDRAQRQTRANASECEALL